MIQTEISVQITCDSDLRRLGLKTAHKCWGTTGRHRSQGEALTTADREGFKPHVDGHHHLCRNCAELNPGAVTE